MKMITSTLFLLSALLYLTTSVHSTTVACTRSGTENEVTVGIQSACSASQGLEYKSCNLVGYRCDYCQTIDPNSQVPATDPIFQATADWCSAQQHYDSTNHVTISYRLLTFRRYGDPEPQYTYKRRWLGDVSSLLPHKRQGENQLIDDLQQTEDTANALVNGDGKDAFDKAEHLLDIFGDDGEDPHITDSE